MEYAAIRDAAALIDVSPLYTTSFRLPPALLVLWRQRADVPVSHQPYWC
jgi:hypothetical protein